jgi:hypothetical protein
MPRESMFDEEKVKEVVKEERKPVIQARKYTVLSIVKSSLLIKADNGNNIWVSALDHPKAKVGDVISI